MPQHHYITANGSHLCVPPVYAPPISKAVADMAQIIAADIIARNHGDIATPDLFRYVRMHMGRAEPSDRGCDKLERERLRDRPTMDDESIAEGIVRAYNEALEDTSDDGVICPLCGYHHSPHVDCDDDAASDER